MSEDLVELYPVVVKAFDEYLAQGKAEPDFTKLINVIL
jgi:hypothetical protein